MELEPINLTELVAVVMGCSIVLAPVLALCVRFALRPVVEALRAIRRDEQDERLRVLEQRVAALVLKPSSEPVHADRIELSYPMGGSTSPRALP